MSELMEQRRVDSVEESLDALEEVFQRIQVVSGEDNLDMLVTRFLQGKSHKHIFTTPQPYTKIHSFVQ